ncbi:CRISPR-associated endonuclease Cas2 [Rhodobacteraceae bacterium 2376]|uniref:CRISPR-associated endoribonuclease Cas2 n=1 Tax=Rhabdonatronobacter sediminivivens TaxID=2743469 RepID=A0A7Z0I1U3_9RHOB|nr:CRISPR-associated endonuclease Cas2 [Rhabdonatronobacter sediminivivens]NYS26386.1 CRISPR-associated endonuclease Cas2 [Rhabdonatronobacter sediminivivens]
MFLVITYDVQADRTETYRKLLTKFLTHEQNSVFAGDLTESEYMKLRRSLSRLAIPGDRILQFSAKNRHNVKASSFSKNHGNGALEERDLLHHSMGSLIL